MAGDQGTLNGFVKGASGPSSTTVDKGRKRTASSDAGASSSKKRKGAPASPSDAARGKKNAKGDLGDKADADELAETDGPTPLDELNEAIAAHGKKAKDGSFEQRDGGAVVYWMRMKDLRIKDNRALALASSVAQEQGKHLVALHVISPGDYKAHDRAAVRIDFVLRNLSASSPRLAVHTDACLEHLQKEFNELNIPLHVMTVEPRKTIPQRVIDFCDEAGATALYGSIE